MNSNRQQVDIWRIPAFGLWLIFFAAGLVPEWIYVQLRELGHVVTQRALINNMSLLPLAMTAYITVFFYQRCCEAGLSRPMARGKSFQLFLLALIAFVLPVRLELFMDYLLIPVAEYRRLLFSMIAVKCIAWLYLLSVVCRYYFFNGYRVFIQMPSLFPSAHAHKAAVKTNSLNKPVAIIDPECGRIPDSPEDSAASVREHGL
ncbi:MAG TPA: hypothetical protein PLI09_19385 [Candidatus Hydrogenedentes bacterium]|mgnify:CR=1 FL=1|nr:hypothetical protein [Candidatus Hydrogenedentota bacterium]